ncbi:MAG: HEAT repeat domain-containing protein [Deferribacteres bacterium]|nr:HEAT repeat domain-containing protein [Deferribacteres bacterium]
MGKVVEKDTEKPIEGVVIVRSWHEIIALPPHPYSGMLAVKETLTDKNGRFMILAKFYIPVPILRQVEERSTAIYKPGYKFLNLYKKRYTVEMEKIPTMYETRKRELDSAEDNSYFHSDETRLLYRIIDRERDFIEVLKSSEKPRPKTRPAIPRRVHPRKRESGSEFSSGIAVMKGEGTRNKEPKNPGNGIKKPSYLLIGTHIEFTQSLAEIAARDIGTPESLVDLKDPDAAMVLIYDLSDEKPALRYLAVSALRKIKDPVSLPHLIKAATSDDHPSVRLEAVRAIGEMGDPAAVPALIAALRDKNLEVSCEAATALGKFDDPREIYAVEPLIEDLHAKNPNIRSKAEYALLQIGVPAVDLLIKALRDKDGNVRKSAALALGKIGDPRAVDPLIELLNSNDEDSSWAAAMALSNFKEKRAAIALVNAMDFSRGYLRQRLGNFLCRIGPVAAEPMTAKLHDKDSRVRIDALNYFICVNDKRRNAFLIDALRDENSWIREYAAGKIAALKDPEFTDALISAWNDKDSEVRNRAASALALIGPAATGKLLATLGDRDPYFRWRAAVCLGKIRDPEAVDSLLVLLNDEVSAVKWSAVYALGEIGDHRAIEPLIAMLGDSDAGIRKQAAQALVQITEQQMFGQDKLKWLKWWEQNKESFMEGKQP